MHRHYGEANRDGYSGHTLKEVHEKGGIVHMEMDREDSFIPLPIVDVVDPERQMMAEERNSEIQAKRDHLDKLLEECKADVAARKKHEEGITVESALEKVYEENPNLRNPGNKTAKSSGETNNLAEVEEAKKKAATSTGVDANSEDEEPILEKEIPLGNSPLVDEVKNNASILQKYIKAAEQNQQSMDAMEVHRKLNHDRNKCGMEL